MPIILVRINEYLLWKTRNKHLRGSKILKFEIYLIHSEIKTKTNLTLFCLRVILELKYLWRWKEKTMKVEE